MSRGRVATGLPQLLAGDYALLFVAERESSQPVRLNRQGSDGLKSPHCLEDRQSCSQRDCGRAAPSECQIRNGSASRGRQTIRFRLV